MTRFILALIRIAALAISFILSTLAASAFITFALFLGGDISWLSEDLVTIIGTATFVSGMWFTIGQLAFAPFALLVLGMEMGRMSSLTLNLLAGGLCAFIVMVLLPQHIDSDPLPYAQNEIWLTAIAAGFIGGFVHWAIAGVRAGRWMGPKAETQ